MTDIMIKNNKLQISDGDFTTVSGVEEVKQHLIAALNTFKGDWVLNKAKGINYSYGFRNTNSMRNDVKKQLLGVKHVRSVDNFEMVFDKQSLSLKVTAIIKTTYGKIYLEENINTQ
ncbi:hypothetical protein IKP85_04930 [bacterium]|nr:hypothetical protein [bacterium]